MGNRGFDPEVVSKELEGMREEQLRNRLAELQKKAEKLAEELNEKVYSFQDRQANPLTRIKVQRNDPCPCGSGLKYKKCCIKYESMGNVE